MIDILNLIYDQNEFIDISMMTENLSRILFEEKTIDDILQSININKRRKMIFAYLNYIYKIRDNPGFILDVLKGELLNDPELTSKPIHVQYLELLNTFYHTEEDLKLKNITAQEFEETNNSYLTYLTENRSKYQAAIQSYNENNKYYDFDKIKYTHRYKTGFVKYKNKSVSGKNILEIFKEIKATLSVPFIYMKLENKEYYKLYSQAYSYDTYKKIIERDEKLKNNYLYMLTISDSNSSFDKKISHILFQINLEKSIFKTKITDDTVIKNILTSITFHLGEIDDKNISGELFLPYKVNYSEVLDKIFDFQNEANYLTLFMFPEDSSTVQGEDNSSLRISLKSLQDSDKNLGTILINNKNGTKISFNKINNISLLQFNIILLLGIMKEDVEELSLLQELETVLSSIISNEEKTKEENYARLRDLKNISPEDFKSGYSKICQKLRPKIISSELYGYLQDLETNDPELNEYLLENKINIRKSIGEYITSSKVNPRVYLICDYNDTNIYYTKDTSYSSKDLDISHRNRIVDRKIKKEIQSSENQAPCCKKIDITKETKPRKADKRRILESTNKILSFQQRSKVSVDILSFFKEIEWDTDINKLGLGYQGEFSSLSAIHCLLYATEEEQYMSSFRSNNFYQCEEIATIYSDIMFEQENMTNIISQENYDNKTDYSFFDCKILYRLLEEYFKVNVIVFEEDGILQIPRNIYGYYRDLKYDTSVFLFENRGSKIDNNTFYIYEILLFEDDPIMKMDKDIINYILGSYNSIKTVSKYFGTFRLYKDLTSTIQNMFEDVVVGDNLQIIDDYGKFRGIYIKETDMYIFTIPSQTFNHKAIRNIGVINTQLCDAINYFKEQDGVILSGLDINNNKIKGLWFSLNEYIYFFYIPIIDTDISDTFSNSQYKDFLFSCPPNPLVGNRGESRGSTYEIYKQEKEKVVKIYKLIQYLYLISGEKADEFVKRVMINESVVYDMKNILQVLPEFRNVNDLFNYIESTGLTKNNNIIAKNEHIKEGIVYFIKHFENTLNPDRKIQYILNLEDKSNLEKYYQNKKQDNIVFLSNEALQKWMNMIEQQDVQNNMYKIEDRLFIPLERDSNIDSNDPRIISLGRMVPQGNILYIPEKKFYRKVMEIN